MTIGTVFINRRKGLDRRYDSDPCQGMPVDLYHRKRRKNTDRRQGRTLVEDYYAFMAKTRPAPITGISEIPRVCESEIPE